jgi:hypothetical protein
VVFFRLDGFLAVVFFRDVGFLADVFLAVVFFRPEGRVDDDFLRLVGFLEVVFFLAEVFLRDVGFLALVFFRADVFFRVGFDVRRPPALAAFFFTTSPTSSVLSFTTLPRLSTTDPTMFCAASVDRTFFPASAPASMTFFTTGIWISSRLCLDTDYPRGVKGQTWPRPGLSQVGRTMAA